MAGSQIGDRTGWKEDEKKMQSKRTEMEFLNINLIKDSSLLPHAIFTVPSTSGF
jgi:hypothetical protein